MRGRKRQPLAGTSVDPATSYLPNQLAASSPPLSRRGRHLLGTQMGR